jgi:hypothetical protein
MALLGIVTVAIGLLLVRAATMDPPSLTGALTDLLGGAQTARRGRGGRPGVPR